MLQTKFTIDGEVVSKARPRFNSKTHHTYTPEKTVKWENWCRLEYQNQSDVFFGDSPLIVTITSYFKIPKSFSKKKVIDALDGVITPTKKPDCDNIAKSILDSLNGIAYDDDKNVIQLAVVKKYGNRPYTEVEIKEYTHESWEKGLPF